MAKLGYKAQLLDDGHLSCPKKVIDKLKLTSGVTVKIIIDNQVEIAKEKKKAGSLYGKFPLLKQITDKDIEEAKKEWDKL